MTSEATPQLVASAFRSSRPSPSWRRFHDAQACRPKEELQEDEQVGYNIVLKACRWPITCIAENAGQDGSLICEKVAEHSGSYGYNAMTDAYEDLITSGVVDPAKVVRSEIENAGWKT
jgi:chaperonin GroEL